MAHLLFHCYVTTSQLLYYVIIVSVHVRSEPATSLQGAGTKTNNIKTTSVCRGELHQDDYFKGTGTKSSILVNRSHNSWDVLLMTNC